MKNILFPFVTALITLTACEPNTQQHVAEEKARMESVESFHLMRTSSEKTQEIKNQALVIINLQDEISTLQQQISKAEEQLQQTEQVLQQFN